MQFSVSHKGLILTLLALLAATYQLRANDIDLAEGIDDSNKIYEIGSSSDFSDFYSMLCEGNTFADYTVVLTKDISFTTGGKSGEKNFEGKFDGLGHKINDITTTLFTNNRGTICNIHVASGSLNQSGVFCTNNYGDIINCKNSANLNYSSSSTDGIHLAAICSTNYGNIINCVNEGNLTLELIAVYGYWSKALSRCGGICAYSARGSSIVYCTNTGAIKNSGIYSAVTGGIVATAEHCTIVGCENKGTVYSYLLNSSPSKGNVSVESYQLQHVGGIAGHVLYCVLNRCSNYGKLSSNFQYLGGIAGYVGNSDVYNLENFGELDGFEGYGFHSVSGIIPYFKNPYKRQYFLNCINHGDITVFAKYGVATGAGISAEIENAYIANCYNTGAISSTNTGNLSAGFNIPQYDCENSEELNTGIDNAADANGFIAYYDSPETLLKWIDDTEGITLKSNYLAYPIAQHGTCNVYVYPADSDRQYTLQVREKEDASTEAMTVTSKSPIEVRGLKPDTDYSFEILSDDNTQTLDNGNFRTLAPALSIELANAGYEDIAISHAATAEGVDEMTCLINCRSASEGNTTSTSAVANSTTTVSDLEENAAYKISATYFINGKEFRTNEIECITKKIEPSFTLYEAAPYSLSLQCDNIDELADYTPFLSCESLKLFSLDNDNYAHDMEYYTNPDGTIYINGIDYDTEHTFKIGYIFKGEKRYMPEISFKTANFDGSEVIQLSKNSAMIRGIFGGLGTSKYIHRNLTIHYTRACIEYRDISNPDNTEFSTIECTPIDDRLSFAATIPLKSRYTQYRVAVKSDYDSNDSYGYYQGEWHMIDNEYVTTESVAPLFINLKFEDNIFSAGLVMGEEQAAGIQIGYKIEDYGDFYNASVANTLPKRITRVFNSLSPDLTYLMRFFVDTEDGNRFYSPVCRISGSEITDKFEPEIPWMTSLSFDRESIEIRKGESIEIKAHIEPFNADESLLAWNSADPAVAYVSPSGTLHALEKGETTVTVESKDGSNLSSSCTVKVIDDNLGINDINGHRTDIEVKDNILFIHNSISGDAIHLYGVDGSLIMYRLSAGDEIVIDNLLPGIYVLTVNSQVYKIQI